MNADPDGGGRKEPAIAAEAARGETGRCMAVTTEEKKKKKVLYAPRGAARRPRWPFVPRQGGGEKGWGARRTSRSWEQQHRRREGEKKKKKEPHHVHARPVIKKSAAAAAGKKRALGLSSRNEGYLAHQGVRPSPLPGIICESANPARSKRSTPKRGKVVMHREKGHLQ